MQFQTGNQFWKQRAKHGREKLFSTPELLWEAACEYFQWCDDNPFQKIEAKVVSIGDYQSQVEKVELPVMRPYTLYGLASFLDCSTEFLRHFEQNNKDSADFMPIIARIKDVIYNQKFSGAASGFFNANIIARDLGLRDSADITSAGEKITDSKKETFITLSNGTKIPL